MNNIYKQYVTVLDNVHDLEMDRLKARVAHRKSYLKVLETEYHNTLAILREFQIRYYKIISPLESKLSLLKKQFTEVMGFVKDSTDQEDGSFSANEKVDIPEEKATKLNEEEAQELRFLFRKLAQEHHPDLVQDPKEKKDREKTMAEITQAYTSQSLSILRKIAKNIQYQPDAKPMTREEILKTLLEELSEIEIIILETEEKCRKLDGCPAMQMRMEAQMARQSGRDLLSDIADNLKIKIEEYEERLRSLRIEPAS